jgi:type IV pilus assembly protein PilA
VSTDRVGGFTLLEILIVLAVLSTLLALGIGSYLRWRASSTALQGAQEFSQAVLNTRTGAKRANACWQLSLVAYTATNTQYQIKEYGTATCPTGATPAPLRTRVYTMPTGTQLVRVSSTGTVSTTSSTINFTPPYGTSDASPDSYQSRWTADTTIKRDIRVTGVFGKVIIK